MLEVETWLVPIEWPVSGVVWCLSFWYRRIVIVMCTRMDFSSLYNCLLSLSTFLLPQVQDCSEYNLCGVRLSVPSFSVYTSSTNLVLSWMSWVMSCFHGSCGLVCLHCTASWCHSSHQHCVIYKQFHSAQQFPYIMYFSGILSLSLKTCMCVIGGMYFYWHSPDSNVLAVIYT